MYKVFFKDSSFLLTDDRNLVKSNSVILFHKDFNETKQFIISQLEKDSFFHATIYHNDIEDLFSIFKSCFIYVKAAGGVVCQENQILLIRRFGMVDLPKGHWEKGETIEQCAIREVEEECGLQNVKITAPLDNTLHIYHRNDNWYLKKSYWFWMSCPPAPTLIPQIEEDIESVYWYPQEKVSELLSLTYPSLRLLFEKMIEPPFTTIAAH